MEEIKTLIKKNISLADACETFGISRKTYYNWSKNINDLSDKRKGAPKNVFRKLSQTEEKTLLNTVLSNSYVDLNPYEIVATLADNGVYLGSTSTIFRLLRKHSLTSASNFKTRHKHVEKIIPNSPNKLWAWDITLLKTFDRGLYFYLYTIIDVFSRKIISWKIYEKECSLEARNLFQDILSKERIQNINIHSDNGAPMRNYRLVNLFEKYSIKNTYSRKSVSNDNPHIESFFKTAKYNRIFPYKPFRNIELAKKWFKNFVIYYNNNRMHSNLNFITPEQMHSGKYKTIFSNRQKVFNKAKKKYPGRFVNGVKNWFKVKEPKINIYKVMSNII